MMILFKLLKLKTKRFSKINWSTFLIILKLLIQSLNEDWINQCFVSDLYDGLSLPMKRWLLDCVFGHFVFEKGVDTRSGLADSPDPWLSELHGIFFFWPFKLVGMVFHFPLAPGFFISHGLELTWYIISFGIGFINPFLFGLHETSFWIDVHAIVVFLLQIRGSKEISLSSRHPLGSLFAVSTGLSQ